MEITHRTSGVGDAGFTIALSSMRFSPSSVVKDPPRFGPFTITVSILNVAPVSTVTLALALSAVPSTAAATSTDPVFVTVNVQVVSPSHCVIDATGAAPTV
jgi:hypothetical protein